MDPVVANLLGVLAGVFAGLIIAGVARRERPAAVPVPIRTGGKKRRRRRQA